MVFERLVQVMEQAGNSQQGLGPTPEARLASECLAGRSMDYRWA